MGDDDVICLSSDDETSPAEPPTKKSKVVEAVVKVEGGSSENGQHNDSNLKRKGAPRNGNDAAVLKRPRVSINGDVEEIAIESPPASINGEWKSWASTESRESSKSSSFRNDTKHTEKRVIVGWSTDPATGIRKDEKGRPLLGGEETARGVRNVFAKSSEAWNSLGHSVSESLDERTTRMLENIFRPIAVDEPVRSRSPTAVIFGESRETLSLTTSKDVRRNSSSKDSEKVFGDSVAGGSKSAWGNKDSRTNRESSSRTSTLDESTQSHHRTGVLVKTSESLSRNHRESTEIVASTEASKERASNSRRSSQSVSPKGSKSVRTPDSKSGSERFSKSSPSPKKSSPEVEIVETPKSSKQVREGAMDNARSSDTSRTKDKSASRRASGEVTPDGKTSARTPQSSPKKQDDRSELASPSASPSASRSIVKSITSLKRITPTSLAIGIRNSSEVGNETRNEHPKNDGSPKSSKTFEPVAGCSKTPDEAFDKSPCSSSNPEEPKPHLVVKTKTPVVSVEQDNFAMFLGLCLQTDRSAQMEKIVAKLKRNYEQLDPVYARSRAFIGLVNETREKISARGRVYYYIGQVAEEMKIRRRRDRSSKSSKNTGTIAENAEVDVATEAASKDEELEEDKPESRRLRSKIKTIEIAMKKCSKKIQQLEVAEVDFDDENNSHYIMLSRYKEKMVELYAKLCEYTNEHADAGRTYLRPKHLRVCQIPSIDQAINSFVNSQLSSKRKKTQTGRSFVDGLVFPDFIDILECVAKVNEKQGLGLDKRRQHTLAEEAFTRLGKHLQDARQKDYWDTFSLHLENSKDPATADSTLSEKLIQNQAIAEENIRAIFEEYVKKQEEGKAADESSGTETEDDDDDDEGDDDNGKKSNCDGSDVVLSDSDVNDNGDAGAAENSDERGDKDGSSKTLASNESAREMADPDLQEQSTKNSVEDLTSENNATANSKEIIEDPVNSPKQTKDTLPPSEPMEIEESSCEAESQGEEICERLDNELSPEVERAEDATSENNNVLKMSEPSTEVGIRDTSVECLVENEATKNEVNPSEEAPTEAINEHVTEPPRILRIRSFAKPPSSWASSQELGNTESKELAPAAVSCDSETIDLLDDDSVTEVSSVAVLSMNKSVIQQPQRTVNGSSGVKTSSKLVKIVPKLDASMMTKQLNLSSGIKLQAANGNQQRHQLNIAAKPASTERPLSVSRNNTKISINSTSGMRVCTLPKPPQRIEFRVAKNIRTLPAGQLKVVKLAEKSSVARANGAHHEAPIRLRPRPAPSSTPQTSTQALQIQPANSGQGVRVRLANPQILQQSNYQQQQVLHFSNGQVMKTAAAIRPIAAGVAQPIVSHPRSITLNNPRLIRLPGNALTGATVARLTDTGQLRVERVENNTNPRVQRLVNGGGANPGNPPTITGLQPSAPPNTKPQREQRTNPLHKSRVARK